MEFEIGVNEFAAIIHKNILPDFIWRKMGLEGHWPTGHTKGARAAHDYSRHHRVFWVDVVCQEDGGWRYLLPVRVRVLD